MKNLCKTNVFLENAFKTMLYDKKTKTTNISSPIQVQGHPGWIWLDILVFLFFLSYTSASAAFNEKPLEKQCFSRKGFQNTGIGQTNKKNNMSSPIQPGCPWTWI